MTGPVGSLTGLQRFDVGDKTATPEQRNGGVADPRHAEIGERTKPYPWEEFPGEGHGPYGLENDLLGMDIASYEMPAGYLAQDPTADLTPLTRAAPWPKGVDQSMDPDTVSSRRADMARIHSANMGGSREMLYEPTLNPQQDEWCEIWEVDPGITFPQMVEIPDQLKGSSMGWGCRDRIQSFAKQNQYGFD